MNKDIDWDAYYNGYSPYEREDIPEDSILHINYEEERLEDLDAVQYLGPKINVTIKQIIYYMHVKKYNAKFLYNNDTIVILLDYSEEVIDKWKNGRSEKQKHYTIVYTLHELLYPNQKYSRI